MQTVPLQPQPSQQVSVNLAGQSFTLNIYQKSTGLYMDVAVPGLTPPVGVVCQNLNRIIRDAYFGVVGDFVFNDTMGTDDPLWFGLGSRWQLVYLEAADLTALNYVA